MTRNKSIKPDHVNMLFRQLSAMTGSGMTVAEAIKTLAEDADDSPVRDIVTAMDKELQSGKTPGEVITKHLPHLHHLPLSALEKDLPAVSRFLGDIAEFSEKRQQLRRFVILSFLYPALVAALLISVISLLLIVVVPMLASMFSDMGQSLPLPTRMVIAVSNFFGKNWFLIPAGVAALFLVIRYKRMWLYTVADKMPVIRALSRKIACAELMRNLALLNRIQIPTQEALPAAAASVTNGYYAGIIRDIAQKSQGISQFITLLRESGLAPAMVGHTIRAGEKSGTLEAALRETSRFVELDAEKTFNRFVVLLYPITIILLGAVVGFCVIAMYMPIFQMGSMAG